MQSLDSVLVIGGCGFLGHHIVSQLLDSNPGAQISVLDLRTDRNHVDSVTYCDGDISSKSQVSTVLSKIKPKVIIHTASPTALSKNAALYDKVNIEGTRNLLACARSVGTVEAFVYTSSASVVHDNIHDLVNADESLPVLYTPQQIEYYSHTKAVAEDLVLAANSAAMLTTAIRPAGIFGEGDQVMIKSMVDSARAGKFRVQIGDGTNKFDFTYAGNAAHAHLLAARALLKATASKSPVPDSKRVDGEAFFVTNGEPVPFWDFARAIGAEAGFPVKKESVWVIPKSLGYALGTVAEYVVWATSFGAKQATFNRASIRFTCMTRTYKIEKARERLGYEPQMGMQEGIRRGVEWCLGEEKKLQ